MRAVVLRSHGGPDSLTIEEAPDPVCGPEDVVVRIRATALNRADLLQVMGMYPNPRPAALEIPGLEFSGVVETTGDKVTLWKAGDAVMGIEAGGAYAEKIATHERQLMRVPTAVGVADGAAIPEVGRARWIDVGPMGPRACRCLGSRHGKHPDRQVHRRSNCRDVLVGKDGSVPVAGGGSCARTIAGGLAR